LLVIEKHHPTKVSRADFYSMPFLNYTLLLSLFLGQEKINWLIAFWDQFRTISLGVNSSILNRIIYICFRELESVGRDIALYIHGSRFKPDFLLIHLKDEFLTIALLDKKNHIHLTGKSYVLMGESFLSN